MKFVKYFAELVVRGTIIGLAAGFALSLTAQRAPVVKEEPVAVVVQGEQKAPDVVVPEGPKEVIPGVPKAGGADVDAFAKRLMAEATVDELKQAYKDCNRTLMEGKLGHGGIQMCGVVYEVLKQKGFEGDYLKFYEWSKTW